MRRTTSASVPRPVVDGQADAAGCDGRRAARSRRAGAAARSASAVRRRIGDPEVDDVLAEAILELGRGPLRDDESAVDDRDPVGEAVRLLEVLRREEDRRAVATRLAMTSQSPRRLAGSRPVVGSSRKSTVGPPDEAGREVEAAAHAARVGPGGRPPASVEVERARAARRRARARRGRPEVQQAADHLEVLATGQVLVDRGVLAGQADGGPNRVRLAEDVVAGHRRPAAVRVEERGEDPDRRRLAGAVGAEEAQDRAGRRPCRSTPRRAWTSPYDLRSPSAEMACSNMETSWCRGSGAAGTLLFGRGVANGWGGRRNPASPGWPRAAAGAWVSTRARGRRASPGAAAGTARRA